MAVVPAQHKRVLQQRADASQHRLSVSADSFAPARPKVPVPVRAAWMSADYGLRPQDEDERATALGLQQSADGLLSPIYI